MKIGKFWIWFYFIWILQVQNKVFIHLRTITNHQVSNLDHYKMYIFQTGSISGASYTTVKQEHE